MKLLLYAASLLLAGPLAAQIPATAPWQSASPAPYLSAMAVATTRLQLTTPSGVWVGFSGNNGQGFSNGQLNASLDNGQSWQQYATYASFVFNPGGSDIRDFFPINAQQAWVLDYVYGPNTATRLRLLQAGTTGFSSLTTGTLPAQGTFAIRFFNATTGLANTFNSTTTERTLYRTTDAAQTWTPVALTPAMAAGGNWSAEQLLGAHFWVSVAGQLAHTPDAGQTWTISTPPQALAQVAFRDAQHGLAYGSGAGRPLYRTTDGGATWTLVAPTGPRRLNILRAVPGAAGTYYSFGKTSVAGDQAGSAISYDEGQTWQTLETSSLVDVAAVGPGGDVWAAYTNYPTGFGTYFTSSADMLIHLTGTALAVAPPAAGLVPTLYPNPTAGPVQLPAAGAYRQVQVYDATGRLCRTAPLGPSETSLDLAPYGPGLYVLRLGGGPAAPLTQRLCVRP